MSTRMYGVFQDGIRPAAYNCIFNSKCFRDVCTNRRLDPLQLSTDLQTPEDANETKTERDIIDPESFAAECSTKMSGLPPKNAASSKGSTGIQSQAFSRN